MRGQKIIESRTPKNNMAKIVDSKWRLVIIKELLDNTGGCCVYCGKKIYFLSDATIDHVVPTAKGGQDRLSNFVVACALCNRLKGDKVDFQPPK